VNFEVIRGRVKKLRALMAEQDMEAFVLFVFERLNAENCHYISGFRGSSAALVIDGESETLITDGRYKTQAAQQSPFALSVHMNVPFAEVVAGFVAEKGYRSVGFESERVFHGVFESRLKPVRTDWKDASPLIPSLRRSKDAAEADAIRRAGAIARRAYDTVMEKVRIGMTEAELGSLLLYEIKMGGGEKGWPHDDFIVVSGERGAMCHGRPTRRAFARGDTVTVDYGVMVDGYVCDITRNFAVGEAQGRAREIGQILIEAHRGAAAALRPGVSGKEVDAVAREIIGRAGYGENFIHGLGHGLGLEVHEAPRLSYLSKDILKARDVVTVEPGIYIEGWGGLRVEDDYLVTETGAECLTLSDDQPLRIVPGP
jgi:Xaa-Pro aminopeptidase